MPRTSFPLSQNSCSGRARHTIRLLLTECKKPWRLEFLQDQKFCCRAVQHLESARFALFVFQGDRQLLCFFHHVVEIPALRESPIAELVSLVYQQGLLLRLLLNGRLLAQRFNKQTIPIVGKAGDFSNFFRAIAVGMEQLRLSVKMEINAHCSAKLR
ncbi:MAG: hypothetical protein IPL73_23650 [Candidatus Obscuribacter sp.]|nr:hypothetical protein [Candidatus Obscuribacter sp.]